MKKFDIKIVLVIILACVMGLSLVACGNKGGGGGEAPEPKPVLVAASEYFTQLFTASKSLGSEKIAPTDNLSISLDMSILLANKKNASKIENSTSVGIRASILLDRKSKVTNEGVDTYTGKNTAVKIQFYNDVNNANLFTAYYFLNDSATAYIDFQDQKFKIGFDTGYNVDTVEGETENSTRYAGILQAFLNEKRLGKDETIMPIMDIINELTASNGADWTINNPVGTLLNVFNLSGTIKKALTEGVIGGAMNGFGLTPEILFDKDGNLNLINILSHPTFQGMLAKPSSGQKIVDKNNANRTIYSIEISKDILNTVAGLIKGDMGAIIKPLLTNTKIVLSYGVIANKIDGFTIAADFAGVKETTTGLYPSIEIKIKDITFKGESENITEATTKQLFGMADKSTYSDQFNLQMEFAASIQNLKINLPIVNKKGEVTGANSVDMSGVYKMQFNACIDLFNKGASNKTRIAATVKKDNTTLIAVNYETMPEPNPAGLGRIVVKVNQEFAEASGPIIEMIMAQPMVQKLLKDMGVSAEEVTAILKAKGSVINDIDVVEEFQKLLVKISDAMKSKANISTEVGAPAAQTTAADDGNFKLEPNIFGIIKAVTSSITTANNGSTVTVKADGLVKIIKNVVSGLIDDDDLFAYILGKKDGVIRHFTDLGLLEKNGGVYQTKDQISLDEARMMYRYLSAKDGHKYANYTKATLFNGQTAVSEVDFNSIIKNYAPYKITTMLAGSKFLEGRKDYAIFDVLGTAKANITGEMGNGFGLNIGLSMGETTIGLDFKISAKAGLPTLNVIAIPTGTPEEIAAAGWLIKSAKPQEPPVPVNPVG